MKILPLLCGFALAALVPASLLAKIERTVERTFMVTPGGMLRVETEGGSIRVQASSDSVVKVIAMQKIRANTDREADELLKKLTLTMEVQGADATATAKYERSVGGIRWGQQPVVVDFVVTVPAKFSANLKTSGGTIVVGDLEGMLEVRTSGGDVKLGKISGGVDAHTSGGNVELVEGGAEVKLSTSGGDVMAGQLKGPAVLRTSGGNIRVAQVSNTLEAKTSGGNVAAVFVGALAGDCELSTSGGDVKATVAATTGFRLDALTSGGDVQATGLTIKIEQGGLKKSRSAGVVNGGGPWLKLRSSGGDIVVGQ